MSALRKHYQAGDVGENEGVRVRLDQYLEGAVLGRNDVQALLCVHLDKVRGVVLLCTAALCICLGLVVSGLLANGGTVSSNTWSFNFGFPMFIGVLLSLSMGNFLTYLSGYIQLERFRYKLANRYQGNTLGVPGKDQYNDQGVFLFGHETPGEDGKVARLKTEGTLNAKVARLLRLKFTPAFIKRTSEAFCSQGYGIGYLLLSLCLYGALYWTGSHGQVDSLFVIWLGLLPFILDVSGYLLYVSLRVMAGKILLYKQG